MLNPDREREFLRAYQSELSEAQSVLSDRQRAVEDAQRALDQAQSEVDDVSEIVARLRRRVGEEPERLAGTAPLASGDPPNDSQAEMPPRNGPTHYRGRVSLPHFLKTLMNDGRRRTVDEIIAAVQAAPEFADSVPTRNTLNTRLSELAKAGVFQKLPNRSYLKFAPDKLAPNGGAENPDERGGPNLAIQLDVEKTPTEEIAPPQSGHPYGGGSAEAASRI